MSVGCYRLIRTAFHHWKSEWRVTFVWHEDCHSNCITVIQWHYILKPAECGVACFNRKCAPYAALQMRLFSKCLTCIVVIPVLSLQWLFTFESKWGQMSVRTYITTLIHPSPIIQKQAGHWARSSAMIMLKEMHYFGHQAHSQIRYQFYLFVCRAERDVISLSQINSLCPTTPESATHFFCFVF